MKEISVGQGLFAMVDDGDYATLIKYNWHAIRADNTIYVGTTGIVKGKVIKMHRLIMNTPSHLVVDHIDHNGLNNQRHNLRNCTQGENACNVRPGLTQRKLRINLNYTNKLKSAYEDLTKLERQIFKQAVSLKFGWQDQMFYSKKNGLSMLTDSEIEGVSKIYEGIRDEIYLKALINQ